MEYKDRSFKTWDEQITKLKTDHNITSVTAESATFALKNYSYYTLVNGYQRALEKESNTELFLDGTSIEQLGQIQLIESHIASDLLHAIIVIEKKIKTIFQYEISRNIGTNQSDYLNSQNYVSRGRSDRESVLNNIREVANLKHNVSKSLIKHRENGNVPPWILINDVTLGQFIHWYDISPEIVKKSVVAEFNFNFENDDRNLEFFKMSLMFLLDFRNGLAHGDVINKIKPFTKIHWWVWKKFYDFTVLTHEEYGQQNLGQNDLYALILILGIFLPTSEGVILRNSLITYLTTLNDNFMPLSEAPMRRLLGGIPSNVLLRLYTIYPDIN